MDILKLGAQLFDDAQGGSAGLDIAAVQSALEGLIGDGDQLNLGSLVAKMQSGGLASLAESWLGDGGNSPVSAQQVDDMLGSDKIAQFASRLNIDPDTARNGLAQVLPELVDKASSGGSLLDSVGGMDGVMGAIGKLIK